MAINKYSVRTVNELHWRPGCRVGKWSGSMTFNNWRNCMAYCKNVKKHQRKGTHELYINDTYCCNIAILPDWPLDKLTMKNLFPFITKENNCGY